MYILVFNFLILLQHYDLDLMACYNSELYFYESCELVTLGRTHWASDQLFGRPLPTQHNITQKHEDKYPCLERDPNRGSSREAVKSCALDNAATGTGIRKV